MAIKESDISAHVGCLVSKLQETMMLLKNTYVVMLTIPYRYDLAETSNINRMIKSINILLQNN